MINMSFQPRALPAGYKLNEIRSKNASPVKIYENNDDVNAKFNPKPSELSIEERIKLIMEVGEEVLTEADLRALFEKKKLFTCYDGFEPSGRMHIAQGIMKAINVNKIAKAGGIFIFWVADWFALLNNKMGGDLNKI